MGNHAAKLPGGRTFNDYGASQYLSARGKWYPPHVGDDIVCSSAKVEAGARHRTGSESRPLWTRSKTLKPHMSVLGLKLIKEIPTLLTNIRCFVADSDATAAYPSSTMAANVSKETTVAELIDILGIDEEIFRRNNLDLLHGHVNALTYGEEMFDLPTPDELLSLID